MKAFSLEEYLKNPSRKVVTRDGRSVRIICTDRKDLTYPVVALNETESGENLACHTKDGRYFTGVSHDYDLFFATEKREGWLNIYRSPKLGFYTRGNPYKSKEEADKVAKANPKTFFATVKVEWEE